MRKVLVDRELLERLRAHMDLRGEFDPTYPPDSRTTNSEAKFQLELSAILAAKPAEAEGVVTKIECTTCRGTGSLEFEGGAVVKDCAPCKGTGRDLKAERYALAARLSEAIAALSAVTAERDRLQAALSAPDTITAEPAGDYDNLRKQFQSLRMLANSNAKMVHYWRAQCDRETRETLLANAASVNAERDTNSMLTDALETAERERDQLRAEVERLRKDAERYRWLRMADWWRSPLCVIRNPKEQAKPGSDCPSRTRLDEAVDAAMAAKEA